MNLITVLAMGIILSTAVYAQEISIEIMGIKLETENEPEIIDGRTMVPVRDIFEGVGAKIDWDGATKTVTGKMLSNTVVMKIDSRIVTVNGREIAMDAAPLILNGRTYAPARYVAESFGFEVEWDGVNKIVKIGMQEQDTTTEITTIQTSTEITTETTTQVYEKYSQIYKGKDMIVNSEIPAGDYVVMPDYGKFAYAVVYKYGSSASQNNASNIEYIINENYEYNGIIHISENQYVSITNGALVPEDIAEKRDVSKNGVFRVGKDIPAAHYTFELDPSSATGYLEIKSLSDNSERMVYKFNKNNTRIVLKLDKDKIIKKYGIDIYDSSLKMYADYSPEKTIDNKTDLKLNFDDIRDSFKSDIMSMIIEDARSFSAGSKSSSRYTKKYMEDKVESWKKSAINDAEKKYIDIIKVMYERFRYFTEYSTPAKASYNYVYLGKTKMTGFEYERGFEGDRDAYVELFRKFSGAKSFAECEDIKYQMQCLYYGVPKGQGWGSEK